jgi:hypothetical protein
MIKKITISLIFTFLTCSSLTAQSVNQIIVGANNNSSVFSANLDGSNPSIIDTGESRFSFYGGVADNTNQKIYMAWYDGIYSMNYDGSNWQQILTLNSGYGPAIDIDPTNQKIYFATNGLQKMDYNGSNIETIYDPSGSIRDIQLDLNNNHIYYSITYGSNIGIKRVNLDGTNPISISSEQGIFNFKINFNTNKIYYAVGAEGKVMDLDGSNSTTLFNNQVGEFDFDLENNKVYFTDMSNKMIKRANYDGTNVENLIVPQDILLPGESGLEPMDIPSGLVLVNNSTLSADQLNFNKINLQIYPNPTQHSIKLKGIKGSQNYTLSNRLGQIVKRGTVTENKVISIENFNNGLYILKLESGNSFKIVKE